MNLYEIFKNRIKIDLPFDLRTVKNLDYVIEKEKELKKVGKILNEECVIGIWGYPNPHGRVEGYGIHTKKTADLIIKYQTSNQDNPIFFSHFYFDKEWLKRKKQRLEEHKWEEYHGQVVYKKCA